MSEEDLNVAEVPANTVTAEDLAQWYNLAQELARVKAEEMLLRQKIFRAYFPNPREGTNSYDLPDGYVLKGKRTVNREVDVATVQALREQFAAAGINADSLIRYKPELKVSEYRELTAEQLHLFDQCLIIKDGSPALEIVKPATRGKAGTKA